MSSIATPREEPAADELPPLYDGQRLSQPEFHRLYERVPPKQWFELIDGVVHMAAAESHRHNRLAHFLGSLLFHYEVATPQVDGVPGTTTIIDEKNEPEPDLQLRIRANFGGQTSVPASGYVTGAPELVIEVSYSTLNKDLRKKLPIYRDVGVQEYWVICVEAAVIRWFVWPEGERQIDADGILRSITFPGLWIDSRALFEERMVDLLSVLNEGLKTPEHAAFVAKLLSQADHK